jgi:hypothetical protein
MSIILLAEMDTRRKAKRYAFDEVRAALHKHWGFALQRGGVSTDLERDGRWDTSYSKTGYVVSGYMPGYGHRHKALVPNRSAPLNRSTVPLNRL